MIVSLFKTKSAGSALNPDWSHEDYVAWQRMQEEVDNIISEAVFTDALERGDPESEAAIRALEERHFHPFVAEFPVR